MCVKVERKHISELMFVDVCVLVFLHIMYQNAYSTSSEDILGEWGSVGWSSECQRTWC